ncbi:MAG: hypothetical protein AUI14_14710 [Actinobacteria bacterium 13_2_20CM_2_71_6]|nr:MAG: hypothetical protein AUI14_14710 [Actinobacteria bacterium 13_2_20CM_2_71_6]
MGTVGFVIALAAVASLPGVSFADEALGYDAPLVRAENNAYPFTESTDGVSVVAIRSSPGSDFDLDLQRPDGTFLTSSDFGGSTVDFVVTNHNVDVSKPPVDPQSYRAFVHRYAGSGSYRIQLHSTAWLLGGFEAPAWHDVVLPAGQFLHVMAFIGNRNTDYTITASSNVGSSGEVFVFPQGNPAIDWRPRWAAMAYGSYGFGRAEAVVTFNTGGSDYFYFVFVSTTPGDISDDIYFKIGPYDGTPPPF